MKNFESTDLFKALRVIKRSGFKEELTPMVTEASKRMEKGEDLTQIGVSTIFDVLTLFAEKEVENELYELLSGPFELDPKDIAKLELTELIEKCEWLVKESNLKVFISQLSNLITMKSLT